MKTRTTLLAAATAAALGVSLPVRGAGEDPASPDAARQTLAKWVETQQIISKERKDWQDAKEILTSRIALLEAEIASGQERLSEVRTSSADVDQRRDLLNNDDRTLKTASAALSE